MTPSHNGKHFVFVTYAVSVFSCLLVLSACQKESKPNDPMPAVSREAAALSSLSSAKIDTGGLVAWYSFDGGSLSDISTYHNQVIFNNATPAPDRNGVANNAYYFNGNGSYIRVKNSPSLNPASQITLFAIMKFDDFYAGACHGNNIIFKGYNDNVDGLYLLRAYDGYYNYGTSCYQDIDKEHETFQGGFRYVGNNDTTQQQYIQTGKWYHVAYTFGSGEAKLYVDGKLVGVTTDHINNLNANPYDMYIGGGPADFGYPYWFHGTIDQVAVFNRALNENQIAKLSAY